MVAVGRRSFLGMHVWAAHSSLYPLLQAPFWCARLQYLQVYTPCRSETGKPLWHTADVLKDARSVASHLANWLRPQVDSSSFKA